MKPSYFDSNTKAGIAGGTLLSIFLNIHYPQIAQTAILAAVGAVTSFVVTVILKMLIKKIRK